MTGANVRTLLAAPVRVRGIQLARPVDAILDRTLHRVVGLEVLCGDETHRFLPLAVAKLEDDTLRVQSPLVLLDAAQLRFYSERGSTFASLRGTHVLRNGRELGLVADLTLAADGVIVAVDVETPDGRVTVTYDETVSLAPSPRFRAAS
jgi:hypothetical protein